MGEKVLHIRKSDIPKLAKRWRISTMKLTQDLMDYSTLMVRDSGSEKKVYLSCLETYPNECVLTKVNTYTCENKLQDSLLDSPTPKDFLTIWYKMGLRKHRGTNTDVYRKDIEAITSLIQGTFFNTKGREYSDYWDHKFTLDEWTTSTSRFALVVKNDDYGPKDKSFLKKLPIHTFLFNPYNRSGNAKLDSVYIYNLTNEPTPKNLFDPYKTLTDSLIEEYKKHKPQWDPTLAERKIIMAASVKCHKFFSDNLKHISPYEHEIQYPYRKAQLVLDAITHKSNGIQPHYLLSDTLYTITLPQHLERIGIWLN